MKRTIHVCVFVLVLSTAGYCQQQSRIELTDGSVINGEIVSYENGVYVINTVAFGEMKIVAVKISKIESAQPIVSGIPVSPVASNSTQSQIDTYRQKIMQNPASATVIAGLAVDAQIQELVKDPEIQAALKAGDIRALMRSEKFMEIVNSPKIQEAVKELKQSDSKPQDEL